MKKDFFATTGDLYLTVDYDTDCQWVSCAWFGPQTCETITTGLEEMLQVIGERKCRRILNDAQLLLGSWEFVVDWVAEDWAPRAVAAGLTHFAHVVHDFTLGAVSALEMQRQVQGLFQMKLMSSLEQGRIWLNQQPQPGLA